MLPVGRGMAFIEPGAYLIEEIIATIGYPGLALLMALDATIMPVPSAVVLGFAGHLSYEGRLNIIAVTLVGAVGSTAGSFLMYGLGRWGGRPFLDRFGRLFGLGGPRMRSAEEWFAKYGDRAVLFSQLVPIARDLIPFPAGMARMSAGRFVLLSLLGSLPFCLVLAVVGMASGPSWEAAVDLVDSYDVVIFMAVLLPLTAYWYLRRRSRGAVRPRSGDPNR